MFYGKSNLQYGKACESAKSNALMRCCKDLGIASELWDPQVSLSSGSPSRCVSLSTLPSVHGSMEAGEYSGGVV